MPRWDTIIRGGTIVTAEEGEIQGDLLIKDGRVGGIISSSDGFDAGDVIDATGKHVLPGAIDPHTHIGFYQPAESEWYSESCAAAAGGVTTFLTFHFERGSYHEGVPGAIDVAERRAVVDFGFQLLVATPQQVEQVGEVASEYGITSFKYPMHWKGSEQLKLGSSVPVDDALLFRLMLELGSLDTETRLCVHSQNTDISIKPYETERGDHWLVQGRFEGLRLWEQLNPAFTEAEPVMRIMYFARSTGANAYIVHISSKETVDLARSMDWNSWNTTGETCVHYLGLTHDAEAGILAKINPPIRSGADQDALWQALDDGVLEAVGTDHCALPRAMKRGDGDVVSAKLAFPGMNCYLPILITKGVVERGLSWQRLVQITSRNPAILFRLYPRKGTLQIGSDADVVIVDAGKRRKVAASEIVTGLSDFSVYEGLELVGWPEKTLVRGRVVYDGGVITAPEGHGNYLRRD